MRAPWRLVGSDGCQWLSNPELGALNMRCRRPYAIAGGSHNQASCKSLPDSRNLGAVYAAASSFAACHTEADHCISSPLACDVSVCASAAAGLPALAEYVIMPTFEKSLDSEDC